ncbi:DoxX family protein [Nonomuraea sp. NPDC050556]|uniref:DoxX family protein n=1 Tax=Nonomuraea sp. NPDC050556 TaxID=3364369 RepID=UPI003789490A
MVVATVIVSVLLAALMAYAAVRKLSHREEVVAAYARAGVPEERLNLLAVILLAGAAGLLAGLVWAPLGIAAAIGTIGYFAVACAAHIRSGDTSHMLTPAVLLALAVAVLVLLVV